MSELTKNITWLDVQCDPEAVRVHEHGFVVLKETMGSDQTIVESARVSYGVGTKTVKDDRSLIRYLVRHHHTSPLEMGEVRLLVKCPVFVWRQWIRHRTANVNELSGRYSELPTEFFVPEQWRKQSGTNKQGGEEPMEYFPNLFGPTEHDAGLYAEDVGFEEYDTRLKAGMSRELARTCLPVSHYTMAYWKCDIHNLCHFLKLRMDKHAQKEIRDFAEAIYKLVKPKFPLVFEAFEDYQLYGESVSRMEIAALKNLLALVNKNQFDDSHFEGLVGRELAEFKAKFGLDA